ncbi:MBL fold metallo-hydrolase [Saccharomonospora saliphila]|uniref:MBL fold metallo-hydrolase n=1 Tax=Saccharomonospora saliphila TaxID=369829 RepID=UPI0003658171|nr:MBL fold metallo-hydrolase [Saccharomonospora saliphila]
MDVEIIRTEPLGDRTYLVHDGAVALVVDPQRDFDRVEEVAQRCGVRITHVAETHLHNDYATGGPALARRHHASYLIGEAEGMEYEHHRVLPGDRIEVGRMTVTAVATPGHTEHHLAYVVEEGGEQAVFSGGSLLYGSVGRTDLVDPERTAELSRAQFRSARRLAELVSDEARLYPTHGFGSFCASGPSTDSDVSTVGEQRTRNDALTEHDEAAFVERLLAGLTDYPSYYAHMAPLNRMGPSAPDLTMPEPLDTERLRERLDRGEWVVDLRNRIAFATKHLEGTVSFEYGDGTQFTTYLGWTLPWLDPMTLVGPVEDVRAALRDLSRIGIDRLDVAVGDPARDLAEAHPTTSYPHVGWEGLAAEFTDGAAPTVLDVRRDDEYETDHVEGALHIPLHELLPRMAEVPAERLWVHCGSGYRAAIAASLLARAGHDVVHVDGRYSDAAPAGVPITTSPAERAASPS